MEASTYSDSSTENSPFSSSAEKEDLPKEPFCLSEEPPAEIKRGQIWSCMLDPVIGSEQGGFRPVLIVQNDIGNRHSPTVIVAIITSKMSKNRIPTHVYIEKGGSAGLPHNSLILLEQLRTVDKCRLKTQIGHIPQRSPKINEIAKALEISLGLRDKW